MSKKIIIDIKNSGEINAETFNIKGTSCLSELDKLLKGFSFDTITKKKPDFYDEKNAIDTQLKQKH